MVPRLYRKRTYGSKDKKRRAFTFICPECSQTIEIHLKRHLLTCHSLKYNEDSADLKQSELRVLYLSGSQDKSRKQLHLPCTDCNKWYLRLDRHLKSGKYAGLTAEERIERLELARIKHWNSVGRTRQSKYASNMEEKLPDTMEEITNYNEDDDNDIPKFVRRAKSSTMTQPLVSSVDYCPPKTKHITEELRRT